MRDAAPGHWEIMDIRSFSTESTCKIDSISPVDLTVQTLVRLAILVPPTYEGYFAAKMRCKSMLLLSISGSCGLLCPFEGRLHGRMIHFPLGGT